MKFETRKTIAFFSAIILAICLLWSMYKGDKDIIMALIPVFSGAITWYFAKSTALDQPK